MAQMENNGQEVNLVFNNTIKNLDKLKEYETSLSNIKNIVSKFPKNFGLINDKTQNQVQNINNALDQTGKSLNKIGSATKLAFSYTTLREFGRMLSRVTKKISSLIGLSSDYLEDINLFQVAFDNNYNSAEKFINKLTEMYGLDEAWLTRTVGIFKQLSNAMNLSTEQGTKLSTLLTQMSVDISSLYNVDINRASSILQSALAGQTKPIRGATGADITQGTLQQTLNELELDTTVAKLSYAEKRLLIIISLTRQVKESTGDWGRTLESPANQTRILGEQWTRFSRALGNVFLPIAKTVLPWLNAILMVLTEILSTIATLFGYNVEDFDYFTGIDDSVLDLQSDLDSTSNSVEKLKRGLRSFDKLNNITTPTPTTSVGGAGGMGSINPKLMEAFNKAFEDYNNTLEEVQMKATKIRDKIMEWLGFTKEINEETGKVSFKFDHITYGTILGALAGLTLIGGSLANVFRVLGKIGKVLGVGKVAGVGAGTGSILGTIFSIAGGLLGIIGYISSIKTEMNKLNTYDYKTSWSEELLNRFDGTRFGKKIGEMLDQVLPAKRKTVVFDASISNETKKKIQEIYDSALELDDVLSKIDFGNKIITDKDIKNIQKKLKSISSSIINELDSDKNKSLENINLMKATLSDNDYNELMGKIDKYYSDRKTKVEDNEKQILDIISKANSENRALTKEEMTTISSLRTQILDEGLNAMSKTDEEYEKLRIRINENINTNQLEQASNYIKTAIKTRDTAIKTAEEQYEGIVLEAERLKKAGVINEDEYNKMIDGAKKTKEETIQNANDQYDEIVRITKEKLGENGKYIDTHTGEIKSKWQMSLEDMITETAIKGAGLLAKIQEKSQKIKDWWNENMSKYFTKEFWSKKGEDMKAGLSDSIANLKTKFEETWNKIKTWWQNNVAYYFTKDYWQRKFDFSSINIKTPHISWQEGGASASGVLKKLLETLNLPTSLPKMKVSWYENGGLPPVGQLFVANERGAELVGNIGGQSFVANQNQVVDLLDRKLANANTGIQNATFIVQVGSEEIGKVVLKDLQKMAKSNGKPITIGA